MEKRFVVMSWIDEIGCYDTIDEVDTWAEVQAYNHRNYTFFDNRYGVMGNTSDLPDAEHPIMDEFDIMEMTDEEIISLVENQ